MKNFQILFLTGHRKSGTTMLLKLFDEHEDFLVYPNDLQFLYAYFPKFNNNKYSFNFKKKRILHILKNNFDKIGNRDLLFKKEKFLYLISQNITKKNINNIESILRLIVQKFILCSKKKNFKYLVLKETSVTMHLNLLKKTFKKIKFIQLIRDPRDNFASLNSGLKKYYNKIGEDKLTLLASMIFRAKIDFDLINFNKKSLSLKQFYLLKFEDLVNKPIKEISKICKFLKVKYDKKLLFPSTFGKKFIGNSFENKKFLSISNKNVGKWTNRLKKEDIKIIEFFFKDIIKQYKYQSIGKINFKSISKFYNNVNLRLYFNDPYKTKK